MLSFTSSNLKFLSKEYLGKTIFAQTNLNKNNFTSRIWWALIEEIALHFEEIAGEKEMTCVRGYHVYEGM